MFRRGKWIATSACINRWTGGVRRQGQINRSAARKVTKFRRFAVACPLKYRGSAAVDHRGANYQAGAGIAAPRPHVHDRTAALQENAMGRTRNFVMGLIIAAAALSGACAS